MGNISSKKATTGKKDDTPQSTGFGRVRIESPDYRLNSPSYQGTFEQLRRNRRNSDTNLKDSYPFLHGRRRSYVENKPLQHVKEDTPLFDTNGIRNLHAGFVDTTRSETSSIASKSSTMFEPGQDSPPISQWIGPALLCAFAYALYNIFIKKGSASIHPILGGVILQFVAAILGSLLCLTLVYGPTQEEMFYDNIGIWYAICAGVSVGAAEIISFMVSGMGVQAVQSIPVIIGGSVFFGTVIGWLALNECLTRIGWAGVAMIAGGITLVGLDPGASLH
jgi:transporter family protein